MLTIDNLWESALQEDNIHSLALQTLNAFEAYNKESQTPEEDVMSRFIPLNNIFSKYYTPGHIVYDFFDQIELGLLKALPDLHRSQFHKYIRDMLSQYRFGKHSNKTLVSILILAFYSDAGGIDDVLFDIWKRIRDTEDEEFLEEVVRYVFALPHNDVTNWIIDEMLMPWTRLRPKLMPYILLKRASDDLDTIAIIINTISERIVWTDYFSAYETQKTIDQLIKATNIHAIVEALYDLKPDSFWFVRGLNSLDCIRFKRIKEKGKDEVVLEYAFQGKTTDITISNNHELMTEIRSMIQQEIGESSSNERRELIYSDILNAKDEKPIKHVFDRLHDFFESMKTINTDYRRADKVVYKNAY